MKVAFFLESNLKNPGGYNQTLSISNFINKSFDQEKLIFITNNYNLYKKLETIKVKSIIYKKNLLEKILDFFFGLSFLFRALIKFNIKHSFTKFLKKNDIDLIIFLNPSELALFCGEINYVFNVWDLDHIKNSPFPEHKLNYTFEKRELFLKIVLYKAFRIIVPHNQNKKDLIRLYNCKENNILVQPLVPYLPEILEEDLNFLNQNERNLIDILPTNKKIILYPATFWAHKNHRYILDSAILLRRENINDFHFVMCGSDRGTFEYINNSIIKEELCSMITTFPLVSNLFLKTLYEKSYAVIMPTDAGPTNLPLYEAMYFKKPIFYSQNILEDQDLKNIIISIDVNDPNTFLQRLKNINNEDIFKKIEFGKKYYHDTCNQENIYHLYNNIILDFKRVLKQWK
jgi:hypothetical protein